ESEGDLKQALVKHRGFIEGRRIELTRYQVKSGGTQSNGPAAGLSTKPTGEQKVPKWKNAEPASEPIGESGRIYVRNLSYACTDDDLNQFFDSHAPPTEVYMPIDSYTKNPKGFAFVTFVFPEHSVNAFNALDQTIFEGRLLHLLAAH